MSYQNSLLSGKAITHEAVAIFCDMANLKKTPDFHGELHEYANTISAHFSMKIHGNNHLNFKIQPSDFRLSLGEFSQKILVPQIKMMQIFRNKKMRDDKIMHMKRKLQCKNRVHLAI